MNFQNPRCWLVFLAVNAVDFQPNGIAENETACERLQASAPWDEMRQALQKVPSPAVLVFLNAGHYAALFNYLCGLESHAHVVLLCADDASLRAAQRDWPGVVSVSLARMFAADVSSEVAFRESKYATLAAVKAWLPYAAHVLGFAALVQDADVVWRGDVLGSLPESLAVMADSNRVDPSARPCRPKEAMKIDDYSARHSHGADCASYRCVSSVNGGFVFVPQRPSRRAADALQGWFERCPTIVATRENQPSFVDALIDNVPPGRCVYNGTTAEDLVVLDALTFASGQRPAAARDADQKGSLLVFHANFRFGWRSKCELLRKLGMLHITTATGDANVCRAQSPVRGAALACRR